MCQLAGSHFRFPSIESAFAAMPGVGLVQADSAVGLIDPTQGPNMGSTAMSSTTASGSVTASQIQGAPQPQGPLSTAFLIPSTARSSVRAFLPEWAYLAEAYSAKNLINTDAYHRSVLLGSHPPVSAIPVQQLEGPDASQSNDVDVPGKAPPLNNNTSASSTRIFIPFRGEMAAQDSHSQTITANSESQNIFTSTSLSLKALPLPSALAPPLTLATQTSITQPFIASGSLSSRATTMHYLSKSPPFLSTSGETMTAGNLGQYFVDGQHLTKGRMTTLTGTTISLAPDKSHINVGMSTEGFGPSATAKFGSGSNGTEVQRFSGNALGARDGLLGSSTMFLVFFVVLLWL